MKLKLQSQGWLVVELCTLLEALAHAKENNVACPPPHSEFLGGPHLSNQTLSNPTKPRLV